MANTIRFSVHRNPQKDEQGRDTYQVRQMTWGTVSKAQLLAHMKRYNVARPELLEMALTVLTNEIVEQLGENRRLHLDGLGTFYLKLGFRERTDEQGNRYKPVFTDPSRITGNDVCVEGIGFTPDKEFTESVRHQPYSFEHGQARGDVGHSADYTDEEFLGLLNRYLDERGYVTERRLVSDFGLTRYRASKWLERLSTGPDALLRGERVGKAVVYRRR